MRIRSWNRNDTWVASLGCGRLLDSWRAGRGRSPKFGLQFADGALQFYVLFRVLFGKFVQLLAKFAISDVERNRQKGRGEQQ